MPEHDEVIDSKVGWVAKHIRRYVESNGTDGYLYQGKPTLLLTTRGRKSGKLYRTALIYGQDGERYLLVPSNGGKAEHPSWYLNLIENPEVELQVRADKFRARARIATPEEKPALWQIMTRIFPHYNAYQKKTKRELPVVILERF
ncbi:MAG: nitroreductase family deazaflavin-dependent oxidoreductase [Anaerolineae bacterium]|nr:nitroreductase family deazaflavin-dependent oxidoreductase [Anaerolineae bacterium]